MCLYGRVCVYILYVYIGFPACVESHVKKVSFDDLNTTMFDCAL